MLVQHQRSGAVIRTCVYNALKCLRDGTETTDYERVQADRQEKRSRASSNECNRLVSIHQFKRDYERLIC